MGILDERIAGENVDILDLTLSVASTAWTPLFVAGLGALVPKTSKDASELNSYCKSGRFTAPISTGKTVARGAVVYYNSAAGTVESTIPAAGFYLGVAAKAGTGTAGYVDVLVNAVVGDVVQPITTITTIATGDATLTAAQVVGGIVDSTPEAASAHTLCTAAELLALVPNAVVGSEVKLTISNSAAATHAITLTATASITNGGVAAHLVVAAATAKTFRIVFSNVTADSEAAVIYLS